MKITNVRVKNFRLLRDVNLSLEAESTVIVGRNNSGKTSLTEIFKKILGDKTPVFMLYDFNSSTIEDFKKGLSKHLAGEDLEDIRDILPTIEVCLTITYDHDIKDYGLIGDFIVDLDTGCNEVKIIVSYQLQNGKIAALFNEIEDETDESIIKLLKELKARIPKLYEVLVFAQDPNDDGNIRQMDYNKFRNLIGTGFINAQRGLDDITHTEKDVLGKVLARLFKTASSENAPEELKLKSEAINVVIKEIQEKFDTDFKKNLDGFLPALGLFGYPGLADPNITTETTMDVVNMLDSHTRIIYSQESGIDLPETYNGLGSRNLIYILFQLFEFFRDWQTKPIANSIYLVFIEEPEAHLHPQMQQIFIKQLGEIAKEFSKTLGQGNEWPVQFVVTTHSTHIANEARFESIRYFLTSRNLIKETRIKDLGKEFNQKENEVDKEFLHKYLTLTKCDLFFADKAILIEGTTERILLPVFIEKVDEIDDGSPKLSLQYITSIEIGGAYAHHFYKFLDFLELRSVVITDLDSVLKKSKPEKVEAEEKPKEVVEENVVAENAEEAVEEDSEAESEEEFKGKAKGIKYHSEPVATSTHSTNSGIKNWYKKGVKGYMAIAECLAKKDEDKISGSRRICFQVPEDGKDCTARSFEDAIMLANCALFNITGDNDTEKALDAYEKSPDNSKKSSFALYLALKEKTWIPPKYIIDGLKWLSLNPVSTLIEEIKDENSDGNEKEELDIAQIQSEVTKPKIIPVTEADELKQD